MSFQTWRTSLNLRIWRRCIYRGHCRLQHPWKRTWWNVSVRRSRSWECPMLWKRLDSGRTTSRARRILVDRCVVPNLPVQPNSPNILKVNFVPTSFTRGKKRQVMASRGKSSIFGGPKQWNILIFQCQCMCFRDVVQPLEDHRRCSRYNLHLCMEFMRKHSTKVIRCKSTILSQITNLSWEKKQKSQLNFKKQHEMARVT